MREGLGNASDFIALQRAREDMQDEAHNAMAKDAPPGLATPWPNPRRYAVTRRLLAYWRWAWERGEESEAARNARKSVENRVAGLGVEVIE